MKVSQSGPCRVVLRKPQSMEFSNENNGFISKATANSEDGGAGQGFVPVHNLEDLEAVLTSRLPLSASVSP